MCKVMPIKRVAEHYNLHWSTVKEIDKAYLKRELEPAKWGNVRLLLMDEFALHKGHRYATVVMDAETKRVLWVGRGRTREEIRPFFEWLGKRRCKRIQAVGMDMWPAFEADVHRHCPNAEIVYDQFHVVSNYGRDVIDRVRVNEANRVKDDKAARELIKGSEWNLLGNWANLPNRKAKLQLNELLEANECLKTVYVMKDALKALWRYTREGWAKKAWETWLEMAQSSGVKPLQRFARNLAKRIDGILSHCRWKLNTSVVEGANNKIKVLKRIAYGYRDEEYFFLKIRAAFPGNPCAIASPVYADMHSSRSGDAVLLHLSGDSGLINVEGLSHEHLAAVALPCVEQQHPFGVLEGLVQGQFLELRLHQRGPAHPAEDVRGDVREAYEFRFGHNHEALAEIG
jgi:transposase